MAKIAGVVHIKINGTSYSTSIEEGFTINNLNNKAELKKDNFGRVYFTEMPVLDSIEGTLLMRDGLDPIIITNLRDAVIKIEFGNDKTFILKDASYTGDGSVDTKEGKFKVKFEGTGKWI